MSRLFPRSLNSSHWRAAPPLPVAALALAALLAACADETPVAPPSLDTGTLTAAAGTQQRLRGHIAFERNVDANNVDIYVMNADGSGVAPVTNTSANYELNPALSPGGTKVAFQRDGDIYVVNVNGTREVNLTSTRDSSEDEPAWSPDGKKIAFTGLRDLNHVGNYDIYVMNADGSGQRQLTTDLAQDLEPAWSPDGTRIAFVSRRDGNPEIYVMNADGSNQRRITTNGSWDVDPAWSPDGTRIAYDCYQPSGVPHICVMDPNGNGTADITNDTYLSQNPSWSPDRRQPMIAFDSNRDGDFGMNPGIYVMKPDGSGIVRLSSSSAFDGRPSWGK